mmetsp:Transcript_108/g.299  ORF Transcript_108/g.299 Transcript_108/m.299 type:complete len:113 (-) Transcript_108:54-392(-)
MSASRQALQCGARWSQGSMIGHPWAVMRISHNGLQAASAAPRLLLEVDGHSVAHSDAVIVTPEVPHVPSSTDPVGIECRNRRLVRLPRPANGGALPCNRLMAKLRRKLKTGK